VTRGIESTINDMKPGLSGIEFDTDVYRPATYVEKSFHNLALAMIIGGALLALALGAFLLRWRTTLICVVVIPLSVLTATLVLWAFGSTINAIVIAGLAAALLLVIDDAVASVENTSRRVSEREGPAASPNPVRTILEASLESRRPAVYATLVVGLAVVPVFFLKRLSGAFFPDLAAAFLLALAASMVVALTVTPALCALLLRSARSGGNGSPLSAWARRRYETSLSRILGRPRAGYAAIGVLLVVAGASAPFVGQSLTPAFKENSLLIRWDGPPGTALPEMNRITALASRELRSVPGVRDVGAHVGRAVTGDQVVGVNSAEIWVNVDTGADYGRTVRSIKRVVAGYPGLSHDVQTYSQSRVQDVLTGTHEDLVVRVYGEDLKTLGSQAAKVRDAVSGVDGVAHARTLLPPEEPTLQVRVDLAKADRYGIKPGDVRRAATTLLSGLVVGNLFEQQKVFDVVVWGTPETRNSLTSVRRLLIDTPARGHVRLSDVASVRIAPSPGIIKRQSVSRYVDVGATVAGRDRGAVVHDIQRRLAGITFPIEYHAEVLAVETQPTGLLVAIAIACAIGMFLLLQAFFGSWRLAALAILALPTGVVGGLVALLAAGEKLSFGSYIGLFAVFGLVVRFGVLLFERFRQLEVDENHDFGARLVLRGSVDRFTPVVTTSVAGLLISLPALVMGDRAGLELVHPVAVVFAGGLITSAALGLLVLPVLYLRFGFSRAAERESQEPQELTAVLDELARGGVSGGMATGIAGVVMTETRAAPERTGD